MIEGKHLNLIIEGWDGKEIEGKLIKRIYAHSKEEAERLEKDAKLEKKLLNGTLQFKLKPNFSSEFGLALKIPFRSSVKIYSEHSDIELSGIEGSVVVENSHGDIKVRDGEGDQFLRNSHGDIEIKNLQGNLKIFSHHTSIYTENIGNAEIEASFEEVVVKNSKNLKIITKQSPLELSGIHGELEIKNSHSKVFIAHSSLRGKIEGEHVEIMGEEIHSEELQISNSYEPITLKGFSGNGKILSRHGEVEIEVKKESNVEMDCRYSDIIVKLDMEWKGNISLETLHGEIESLGQMEGIKVKELGSRKSIFADLGGNNTIKVKTTYGKITIEGE